MPDDQLAIIRETIEATIRKTVNGKIDALRDKVDDHNTKHEADMVLVRDHIERVEPYLEGAKGVKLVADAIKWFAGVNSTNNQGVATAGSGWTFTAPSACGGATYNFWQFSDF